MVGNEWCVSNNNNKYNTLLNLSKYYGNITIGECSVLKTCQDDSDSQAIYY